MRWKLLFITSLIAAVIGLGLWSAFAVALYGSANALARHQSMMFASSILPLTLAAIAAVFVYRHTATKRKTQAVITVLIVLVLLGGTYLAASRLFPNRLTIRAHF